MRVSRSSTAPAETISVSRCLAAPSGRQSSPIQGLVGHPHRRPPTRSPTRRPGFIFAGKPPAPANSVAHPTSAYAVTHTTSAYAVTNTTSAYAGAQQRRGCRRCHRRGWGCRAVGCPLPRPGGFGQLGRPRGVREARGKGEGASAGPDPPSTPAHTTFPGKGMETRSTKPSRDTGSGQGTSTTTPGPPTAKVRSVGRTWRKDRTAWTKPPTGCGRNSMPQDGTRKHRRGRSWSSAVGE